MAASVLLVADRGLLIVKRLKARSPPTWRSCSRPRWNWSSTTPTARMLGLTVSPSLLAIGDEVIE
jgi:hypothetical protein